MSILQKIDSKFTSALLFGDTSFDNKKNTFILDATTDYIIFISGYLYSYSLLGYFYYMYVTALIFTFFVCNRFFSHAYLYIHMPGDCWFYVTV